MSDPPETLRQLQYNSRLLLYKNDYLRKVNNLLNDVDRRRELRGEEPGGFLPDELYGEFLLGPCPHFTQESTEPIEESPADYREPSVQLNDLEQGHSQETEPTVKHIEQFQSPSLQAQEYREPTKEIPTNYGDPSLQHNDKEHLEETEPTIKQIEQFQFSLLQAKHAPDVIDDDEKIEKTQEEISSNGQDGNRKYESDKDLQKPVKKRKGILSSIKRSMNKTIAFFMILIVLIVYLSLSGTCYFLKMTKLEIFNKACNKVENLVHMFNA